MSIELPLIPGSLPTGFCPETEQERYNKYLELGYAQLDNGSGWAIHVSDTAPVADRRGDTVWLKLDADRPLRLYKFEGGYWTSLHPIPAGGNERMIWVGNPTQLWAYDEGGGSDPSVTIPTALTGAFWEVDTEFDARTLVGAGTLPLSGTAIVNTTIGGVDQTILTKEQIPPHQHKMGFQSNTADGVNKEYLFNAQSDYSTATAKFDTEDGSNNGVGLAGVAAAHDNMPPYYGVYIAKRTIRTHYTSAA